MPRPGSRTLARSLNPDGAGTAVTVEVTHEAPAAWDHALAWGPLADFTTRAVWTTLAARHYRGASGRWIAAYRGGDLIGGLPLLCRRRRGLARLESSFDGTAGGPLVRSDLGAEHRPAVVLALARALAGLLGGATGLAAMTLAGPDRQHDARLLAGEGWQAQDFASAVVDCRQGLDHVGHRLWTNNRRNERNRGLKRGCTLHAEPDPEALADWYPLYDAKARQWAQAPVPHALLADLLINHPDDVRFDHVRLDGRVVGGHLGFISRRRLVAWQGAVHPDLARTHFLTTLLYWRNLMTACELGLDAVDFGGHVGRDSLWDFKRRCGAVPEARTQLVRRTAIGRAHAWLARVVRRDAAAEAS